MKASYLRQYRKPETGNVVFVYTVSGTNEELSAYKDAQGSNYVEDKDSGTPLFFSVNYVGNKAGVIITDGGKAILDTSRLDQLSSLANQAKGAVATELARLAAMEILGMNPSAPISTPAPKAEELESQEDLGEL
jgi:hypothetical protein